MFAHLPISLGALAICLGCGAAQAAPEDQFLQAALGAANPGKGSVCFARTYDAAHLAAHKGQRVRDVAIRLTIRNENNVRRLDHGLATHFVGSRQLYWSGGQCARFDGLSADCHVEGDGGAAVFTLSADGRTLTARFDHFNVWRPQDAADETTMQFDKSPVDKIARLDRAPDSMCKAVGE